MSEAVKFKAAPSHKGLLLDAFGVEGVIFITIELVPALLEQPFTVTVTEYVPAANNEVFAIVGFCIVELKPLGPVQVYVASTIVRVVKFKVFPVHIGELLSIEGVSGLGLMVTAYVNGVPEQPLTVGMII